MMEDTVLTLSNQKKYFVVDQLNIKGTEYIICVRLTNL